MSEAIDLGALIGEHLASLNATVPDGIRVDLVMDSRNARVFASPERLSQVFENLLANAISFSPAGPRSPSRSRSAASWAVVTIDDSGPGIPEGHLDRVFQRFFTYRPGDAQREHVGLGLAIAKQIVESYGGGISASNRPAGAQASRCASRRRATRLGGSQISSKPLVRRQLNRAEAGERGDASSARRIGGAEPKP